MKERQYLPTVVKSASAELCERDSCARTHRLYRMDEFSALE
jgi:hypothetical protein